MKDYRSSEAAAYRALYKSTAWRKGRVMFLRDHPLCDLCQARGVTTAATVVNHRKPHKGDLSLFFSEMNWQALCKLCHDGEVQSTERRGFSNRIGHDGWPIDSAHPANR